MLKFNAMCSCETCHIVDEVVPTGSCGLSKSCASKNKKGIIQTKNISSSKVFLKWCTEIVTKGCGL